MSNILNSNTPPTGKISLSPIYSSPNGNITLNKITTGKKMTNIGFIGLGFVGSAILNTYADSYPIIKTVCVDPEKGYHGSYQDLLDTDGIFVSVPSPQNEDGSCCTEILESVLQKLKDIDYYGVIISKVTAPPDVYNKLQDLYPNLVHSPEFLTAANAAADYLNSKFLIIGGKVSAYRYEAERIIKLGLNHNEINVMHCSISEASLTKYTMNCFLATKVVFMNEIHKLAAKFNCDYTRITEMLKQDPRIGPSHLQVPGPDGVFGFGGMCFPKDTNALLKFAETANVEMSVLNAAVKKNTLLRLT